MDFRLKKRMKRNVMSALIAAFSSMVSAPGAYTQISLTAFKGVTRCFIPGKEFFSPTVGASALYCGLINNMRLFGNCEAARNVVEGGVDTRDYINDRSSDPVWNVVKILFPSSGGQLSGESTFSTSFGKVVDDPRSIAILLNFVNEAREGYADKAAVEASEKRLEEGFLETLNPAVMGTKNDRDRLETLLSQFAEISQKTGCLESP